MKRYNLRAADKAALQAALIAAGVLVESEDEPHVVAPNVLDVIGVISRVTGEDKKGDPIIVTEDGYHANLIADLTKAQEKKLPIIPAPANPFRIFAGENNGQ